MYLFRLVKKGLNPDIEKSTFVRYAIIKVLGTLAVIIGLFYFLEIRLSWITQSVSSHKWDQTLNDPSWIGAGLLGVGLMSWFFAEQLFTEDLFINYDPEEKDEHNNERKYWITHFILLSYYILTVIITGVLISLIEGAY